MGAAGIAVLKGSEAEKALLPAGLTTGVTRNGLWEGVARIQVRLPLGSPPLKGCKGRRINPSPCPTRGRLCTGG